MCFSFPENILQVIQLNEAKKHWPTEWIFRIKLSAGITAPGNKRCMFLGQTVCGVGFTDEKSLFLRFYIKNETYLSYLLTVAPPKMFVGVMFQAHR